MTLSQQQSLGAAERLLLQQKNPYVQNKNPPANHLQCPTPQGKLAHDHNLIHGPDDLVKK
jgi:hypothetical protein